MSNQEITTKKAEAPETSKPRTLLWLGLGLLVYVFIQWMMPKVGLSS